MQTGLNMPSSEGRELGHIRFRDVDLPEILNWKVGKQYYIVLKVEQKSLLDVPVEMTAGDKRKEADFVIRAVRALEDRPKTLKEMEDEEYGRIYAKKRSGALQ